MGNARFRISAEWVSIMRTEFSKQVKRDAADRAKGYCDDCKMKLRLGEFHYDHRIPDWMGGEASLENCQVLCHACHKVKTREDIRNIAKSKRIIDRNRGIKNPAGNFATKNSTEPPSTPTGAYDPIHQNPHRAGQREGRSPLLRRQDHARAHSRMPASSRRS